MPLLIPDLRSVQEDPREPTVRMDRRPGRDVTASQLTRPCGHCYKSPMHGKSTLLAALGRSVRERRNELNITQADLAAVAGLHRTYVAEIERGRRNVSLVNLERLATALKRTLPELFDAIVRMKKTIERES